jgi:plasmid stabilization system protein ParE
MTVLVRLHPEAQAELREALACYHAIDPDLARRMRQETDDPAG